MTHAMHKVKKDTAMLSTHLRKFRDSPLASQIKRMFWVKNNEKLEQTKEFEKLEQSGGPCPICNDEFASHYWCIFPSSPPPASPPESTNEVDDAQESPAAEIQDEPQTLESELDAVQTSEEPAVADGNACSNFTDDDEKMFTAHDGKKECVVLAPILGFMTALRVFVVSHRELKDAEDAHDERLDSLENEFHRVTELLSALDDEYPETQPVVEVDDTPMAERRWSLENEKEALEQRAIQLQAEMKQQYKDFRDNNFEVLELLDEVLSKSGLIDAASEECNSAASLDEELQDENAAQPHSNKKVDPEPLTPRKLQTAPDEPENPDKAAKKLKSLLLRDFLGKRTDLHYFQDRLEERDEIFQKQSDERQERLLAGEEVETATEFGLRQVEQLRQMTRDVIQAEAVYNKVRADALAANVQLGGYGIESGFIDDPEDGIRESDTDIDRYNPDGVLRWLKDLPDVAVEMADYDQQQHSPSLEPKLDDWDAESVEIHDSWSMVAEGPEKKRIEKWNALRAEYAEDIDLEGSPFTFPGM